MFCFTLTRSNEANSYLEASVLTACLTVWDTKGCLVGWGLRAAS